MKNIRTFYEDDQYLVSKKILNFDQNTDDDEEEINIHEKISDTTETISLHSAIGGLVMHLIFSDEYRNTKQTEITKIMIER